MSLYIYQCIIRRVVDADTVDVDIDLGFDTWIHQARVRLHGVDAPEVRTTDLTEKYYGNLAAEFVRDRLEIGEQYILHSREFNPTDAFGRILGDFELSDGCMLTQLLLQSHHAVHWNPDNRTGMQEQHLANQRMLAEAGYRPTNTGT